MDRDKQIDDMTCKDNCIYYEMCYRRNVRCFSYPWECPCFKDNAGYRKSTDVAREIFAEVKNAWANSWTESEFLEMLKELKKKYTESEGEG